MADEDTEPAVGAVLPARINWHAVTVLVALFTGAIGGVYTGTRWVADVESQIAVTQREITQDRATTSGTLTTLRSDVIARIKGVQQAIHDSDELRDQEQGRLEARFDSLDAAVRGFLMRRASADDTGAQIAAGAPPR